MQTPIFQIFAPQMPPPAKCPPPSSPCRAPRTAMALRVNSSALVRTYVGLGPACFGLDFKCFCKNRIRVYAIVIWNPHYKNRITKIEVEYSAFSAKDSRAYGHIHIAVD